MTESILNSLDRRNDTLLSILARNKANGLAADSNANSAGRFNSVSSQPLLRAASVLQKSKGDFEIDELLNQALDTSVRQLNALHMDIFPLKMQARHQSQSQTQSPVMSQSRRSGIGNSVSVDSSYQ